MQSNLPWPAQGRWPVLGHIRICRHRWSAVWSKVGPKTDPLGLCGGGTMLRLDKEHGPENRGGQTGWGNRLTQPRESALCAGETSSKEGLVWTPSPSVPGRAYR
ncbi:hypothetical protein PO909_013817 [Leuciscus waleckii]